MMADGRCRNEWAHTAALLCQTANINRDPEKRSTPFRPEEFNPYTYIDRKGKGVKVDDRMPGSVSMLKDIFCRGEAR